MSKIIQDLTGKKFGKWTVINKSTKKYYWTCKCDCGLIKDVGQYNLINGRSLSCWSCSKKKNNMKIILNRIGQKHGKLAIIEFHEIKDGVTYYKCKCDCGNIAIVRWNNLKKKAIQSCGCNRYIHDREIYFKEGTNLTQLNRKVAKNSTTGVTGVNKTKNGKYRAVIKFQNKNISLGTYDTIEEATLARQMGEDKYFKPILEKYNVCENKSEE